MAMVKLEINNGQIQCENCKGIMIYFLIIFSGSGLVSSLWTGYYPKTENWQKTLGDFLIWISADIKYDGKKDEFSATIVVHSLDFYDFNSQGVDLATGTPDAVNGRFSTLGWAKGFETKGKLTMKISWRI